MEQKWMLWHVLVLRPLFLCALIIETNLVNSNVATDERNLQAGDACDANIYCEHGLCTTVPEGTGNQFLCVCDPGWGGPLCDTEWDYCGDLTLGSSVLCLAKGTCTSSTQYPYYSCECESPWTGYNCESFTDRCLVEGNPCQNDGVCYYHPDTEPDCLGRNCLCEEGYAGNCCELSMTKGIGGIQLHLSSGETIFWWSFTAIIFVVWLVCCCSLAVEGFKKAMKSNMLKAATGAVGAT